MIIPVRGAVAKRAAPMSSWPPNPPTPLLAAELALARSDKPTQALQARGGFGSYYKQVELKRGLHGPFLNAKSGYYCMPPWSPPAGGVASPPGAGAAPWSPPSVGGFSGAGACGAWSAPGIGWSCMLSLSLGFSGYAFQYNKLRSKRQSHHNASVTIPPPSTRSPSYKTADWPGVIARSGSTSVMVISPSTTSPT